MLSQRVGKFFVQTYKTDLAKINFGKNKTKLLKTPTISENVPSISKSEALSDCRSVSITPNMGLMKLSNKLIIGGK